MSRLPVRFGADKVVIVNRLPDGRGNMGYAGNDRPVGRSLFPHNSVGDPIREAFAITALQDETRFSRVSEETAFHEHSGDGSATKDKVATTANATILSRGAADQMAMNASSE